MAAKKKTTKKAATKKKVSIKKAGKKKAAKKVAAKTLPTRVSVTAFVNAVEHEGRKRDAKTILALMKKLTGEKAVMWGPSIIGFGSYHYKYESGHEGDMLLVGFSPRKANLVLYVLGSIDEDDPLLDRLGKYKRGRACLYVNKLEDVDMKILEKVIMKSYRNTKKRWKA